MTIVTAPNHAIGAGDYPPRLQCSIFLAGGITGCENWQNHVCEYLKPYWPLIFNPRRSDFPMGDKAEGRKQIRWEFEHLNIADVVLFWFSWETVQPIVLYELGRIAATGKEILVGAHPKYERRFDVAEQLYLLRPATCGFLYSDIDELCEAAIEIGTRLKTYDARTSK